VRQLVRDEDVGQRIADIQARLAELNGKYTDGKWLPKSDLSYLYWTYFDAYQMWPFPGALTAQPEWLLSDFAAFNEIAEVFELGHEEIMLTERLVKMVTPHG
jgi:hypothetical protein